LQPAAPVIRTDHILITALNLDPISLLPSRSDLEFIPNENAYSAMGRIINLRNSRIRVTVVGKYEIINEKFTDIQNSYDPDILENRKIYNDDILSKKINTDKYGYKTLKYTLLNKEKMDENVFWIKVSF
jgi:hypothetical protein